ncbi:hypothetical protein CCACVL1_02973 [Corchorus capsularis]|uniref:Uncharacterized protein n=1 Tax=Corchorus capsularis TaxID=210143 RepID=A0A1R3K4F0_COCAP|nr:hypothetical protein CCACVL1_02973 [Corchorus capsularis]
MATLRSYHRSVRLWAYFSFAATLLHFLSSN